MHRDLESVRRTSAATDIRVFHSEDEMFHGFRDVLREHGLSEATIAVEKNLFDAAFFRTLDEGTRVIAAMAANGLR